MSILIVTTPIRPIPTNFPPFGSLALIQYLRLQGIDDVRLYDIDCLRPEFDDAVAEIVKQEPTILGISAVVSTAYAYVKKLSLAIKAALPNTLIVLGGNMGASAEIILNRTGVDVCVLGEGEVSFSQLALRVAESGWIDRTNFSDIPGLTYLGFDESIVNTGYAPQLPANELYDINWDDLEEGSDVTHFFPPNEERMAAVALKFNNDKRVIEPHRKGKSIAYLYTSKGCVSRCTFCHRWDKGLRSIPVDLVMRRLDELIERYNVGFLHAADENFGADAKWLASFCAEIKKRDVIWTATSRARGMSDERLKMLHDSGCAGFGFGTETGSPRILEVMEKKISIEENYEALRITHKHGMPAPLLLVIGMPGETRETITETIELCKYTKTLSKWTDPNTVAINYAQALPGTPLYEYARHKGMIGKDMTGEENYLLAISDRDAHDEYTTLNFTDQSDLECQTWRPLITIETNHHFVKTFGIEQYHRVVLAVLHADGTLTADSGYYANPQRLLEIAGSGEAGNLPEELRDREVSRPPSLLNLVLSGRWGLAIICYPVLANRLKPFLIPLVILKSIKKFGLWYAVKQLGRHLSFIISGTKENKFTYQSLRKTVDKNLGQLPGDNLAMVPLRKGR